MQRVVEEPGWEFADTASQQYSRPPSAQHSHETDRPERSKKKTLEQLKTEFDQRISDFMNKLVNVAQMQRGDSSEQEVFELEKQALLLDIDLELHKIPQQQHTFQGYHELITYRNWLHDKDVAHYFAEKPFNTLTPAAKEAIVKKAFHRSALFHASDKISTIKEKGFDVTGSTGGRSGGAAATGNYGYGTTEKFIGRI